MKNIITTSNPYFIIEAANTHGGNFEYLLELIDAFKRFSEGFGMKLQAFHPDCIATKDFSSYDLYSKLFFNNKKWRIVIDKVYETKDVWLDIFDTYGVMVLNENINKISGIKLQSSVLYNYEVLKELSKLNLYNKKVILNIAANPVKKINEIVQRISGQLNPFEILLECGYQGYPTSLEDSGLSKIGLIKKKFSNRIVFADHVDGKTQDAIWLPVVVAMSGIDIIEKHVMLEKKKTVFDHFSSLTPSRFVKMVKQVERYTSLKNQPFINDKEKLYLNNTLMIPILKHNKKAGSLLNFDKDFIFRRSGKKGLNAIEIEAIQSEFHVLAKEKKAGETIQNDDFKKATIATIIACRLKSTRLKKKALQKIGMLSSVECCIKSCLKFKNTNYTVLATSDLPEDAELGNYTYSPEVVFYKGDPDNVIQRYLVIADKLEVDVIIRVTADNPFGSDLIVEKVLNAHFAKGADYSTTRKFTLGTGAEIINTLALKEIKKHFAKAEYSEYMSWYFQNNPEYFNLNFVDLPENLIRDYRLTLDYPEDLVVLNKIQAYFNECNMDFDIQKIYEYLDNNPGISQLNSHLTQRYKTDNKLIETLNRVTKISGKIDSE